MFDNFLFQSFKSKYIISQIGLLEDELREQLRSNEYLLSRLKGIKQQIQLTGKNLIQLISQNPSAFNFIGEHNSFDKVRNLIPLVDCVVCLKTNFVVVVAVFVGINDDVEEGKEKVKTFKRRIKKGFVFSDYIIRQVLT